MNERIMAGAILIGLVILAGLSTELIDRFLNDGWSEFCNLECSKNKIIYK